MTEVKRFPTPTNELLEFIEEMHGNISWWLKQKTTRC